MSKKDNITKVEFGTPQPNVVETTEEQEAKQREYIQKQREYIHMCVSIGQSTLEWALNATKEDYINHMMELYNHLNVAEAEAKTGIVVPDNNIILPK